MVRDSGIASSARPGGASVGLEALRDISGKLSCPVGVDTARAPIDQIRIFPAMTIDSPERDLTDLSSYRAEFPILQSRVYLNTCSLGPLSRRSRDRIARFLEVWNQRGAAAWYDEWWEDLANLRTGYAQVVGAGPHEIALHASISTALSAVASSLDYRERPKVVTTNLDFPTVAYQWLAQRPRGVELVMLESPDGIGVELEQFERAVDESTALVATSHVYFTSGYTQDIAGVAKLAHARGARCLIDAYQSVGQFPVNAHETGIDFLVAGGLKWLLGGPGIAFLYVKESLIDHFQPSATGWFAHRSQFDFDPTRLELHRDARRFEMGTPALAAVQAQLGGLEVIQEAGLERIASTTRALTEDLISRARDAGLSPKVAADRERRAAIVMIPHPEPHAAVEKMAGDGITVDARPGHVRISSFFYNNRADHVAAIESLSQIAR